MTLNVEECFKVPALRFFDQLGVEQRENLLEQMESLDVDKCLESLKSALSKEKVQSANGLSFQPIKPNRYRSMLSMSQAEKSELFSLGLEAIAAGQVAVVLLSGGQGTRLGVDVPKGAYNIGLPSGKSLFQLQAERILKLQSLAANGKSKFVPHIPWCVMVSESTEQATIDFFKSHNYFGLSKCQIIFFCQGMTPCFGLDGKVLLSSAGHVATAPNGNGGLYEALNSHQLLDRLGDYGIRYVHVHAVDNVLVRVADPWFIGFCKKLNADCAVKTLERNDPQEPLGVVCQRNGKPCVVEYSEIDSHLASQRDQDGKLLFRAGNIANHMFTLEFLQNLTREDCQLPYHLALKKISYLNEDGVVVHPDLPNGYKLERFVFDVFPYAKNFAVFEVVREEEFSPLKNVDSARVDCPATCLRDVFNLHSKWVRLAGGRFANDDEKVVCEISPLLSYAGEGLSLDDGQAKLLASPLLLSGANEST